MKIKAFILVIICSFMIFLLIYEFNFQKKEDMNILLLPSLPKPIAKENALITSAGQSTEAYIINDIANKLMIHNYFMPQAKDTDLDGINTIVFVVGYSPLGEKINGINFDDEKKRIIQLLSKAKEKKLVILTIYIGGKEHRDKNTDELLKLIYPSTNYLIATKEADDDGFLSKLAKKSGIPLTLINDVSNISEPISSAFR